jgi:hypothetical protein
MNWLIEHWRGVAGTGSIGLLLLLWQRGFFQWAINCVRTLRKAFRDQQRIDAEAECTKLSKEVSELNEVLRVRIRSDDARDEIHQQDIADKKQMSATIERLKERLRENRINFDDLL